MLNSKVVDSFLQRLGVDNFNHSVVNRNKTGDIISVFDPDFDFSGLRDKAMSFRPVSANIVDSGITFFESVGTVYVNGNRVKVSYLCSQGRDGFGTVVKVMVKSVSCTINGELKNFLGFGDMKQYIDRFIT